MVRPPVETVADQLFYTTVLIETFGPSGAATGTGFLINYPAAGDQIFPVLVTNKHVFEGAEQAAFTLARSGPDDQPLSAGTRMLITDFGPHQWVGHSDPTVDVAAMLFGFVLTAMANNNAPAFYRGFSPDQLATQETADSLDAIEQITMVGYPNGLFDQASMLPIARRGQTATPIFNNYNGTPAFLIDASVFPGSSGSPVVLYDRGTFTTRYGTTHVGTRLALLGVVAAVHTRQVNGQIQVVGATVATFQDPINLGIVFKASAIQETAIALLESSGAPQPVVQTSPDDLA